ncbi:MAG TPA: Hsp20/alpha crystallin family protein [Candidatus Paceibacterota bacterium]|nr:Hsp20/alpha crystallin family protein [Candidatus Paceibacterota bacterium]
MKKPSFFERLAGNLRFDDSDDATDVVEERIKRDERHINLSDRRDIGSNELLSSEKDTDTAVPLGEIGELPVDVYETPNEIIIQTLIAGVLPENLSIDITRDMVRVSGKREESKGIPNDAYHMRELYWGAFERAITLPHEVEIDAAEAIERHGMLIIKLPKVDKRRRTMLKIKSI